MGYAAIAHRLYDEAETVRGSQNPYWDWIENYVAEEYVQSVNIARGRFSLHISLAIFSPK
jgi:hydroxymethylpyrimidine/phosphomethylpyrimidine kinase